jgi:hypothetical protein
MLSSKGSSKEFGLKPREKPSLVGSGVKLESAVLSLNGVESAVATSDDPKDPRVKSSDEPSWINESAFNKECMSTRSFIPMSFEAASS